MPANTQEGSAKLKKFLLALAVSSVVHTAWAQDAQEAEEEDDAADLGRITVTGSLIKREDFTSTSPMQVIDAETQFQAGQLSVADILQNTTIAGGTTQLNNQFNGFVIGGGTGVRTLDLRGLGAARTLVLLNGRRPGGSGTRGQVNSLDLNSLPDLAVNRVEIVLDGSSSIYGSDAVSGVANVITRRSVDSAEITAQASLPEASGGEFYRVGGIFGGNSSNGSWTVSAQYDEQKELRLSDRDFLQCNRDLYRDAAGNIIDREDRGINAGTENAGCFNLYANTVLAFALGGARFVQIPGIPGDPALPGYRIRENANYIDSPDGQAFYEDQLYFPVANSEMAVNNFKNTKVYATADYSFGNVDWDLDFLYTNRNTIAEGWRQFFPQVGAAGFYSGDPGQFTDPFGFISLPVMPYISNSDIDVDYYYLSTGLSGVLNTDKFWSWQVYGSYSYSDGDYTRDSILASRSGDLRFDANGPVVNYFSTPILNGTDIQSLIDAVGVRHTGNTIYDQAQIVGILSGDLMELPAGTLGTAFGLEYRTFSIDDQPSIESRSGDLWGESSALVTKGDNSVIEAFLEADIPLIANKPGIESLTLNGSVRGFDYDKGGKDVVWKAGLNWQIIPSLRLRSTVGTSYRAPALFEQFLGNETSFADQFGIDPCIEWGQSNNENLRANCGSLGIPDDYNGGTASISATIIAGGGVDNLESETSDSFTAGFVFTPEGTDLNIAVDYFDITVNNQIAQLGAGSIVFGCYGGENFPNAFCDLVNRAPASSENPFLILTVQNNFVNVNEQATKGVDLNMSWNVGFDAGDLQLEAQSTWVFENISRLFEPGAIEGFDEVDQTGRVSSPEVVANLLAAFSRNDWTVTYRAQYVSATDNEDIAPAQTTYQGIDPAFRDNTAEAVVYHNLSFFYAQDKWDVLVGINNLLDEEPATMSDGAGSTLRGNSPLFATQYDLFGRRVNARLNFRF